MEISTATLELIDGISQYLEKHGVQILEQPSIAIDVYTLDYAIKYKVKYIDKIKILNFMLSDGEILQTHIEYRTFIGSKIMYRLNNM